MAYLRQRDTLLACAFRMLFGLELPSATCRKDSLSKIRLEMQANQRCRFRELHVLLSSYPLPLAIDSRPS